MGGVRVFIKSQPCRNLLGPSCFDGKFYRRPPIKFYIISTAMVHDTRTVGEWWTHVDPADEVCRLGKERWNHWTISGTCCAAGQVYPSRYTSLQVHASVPEVPGTYMLILRVTMRHRCRKSLLGPLVFSPRLPPPLNSCCDASFLFLSPFPQYSP